MGVKITEILSTQEIDLAALSGKIILIDTPLFLYQFLTTIRQRDGTPLMDSKGGVTSHLMGLFTRTSNLMRNGLRVAYVFDGKPPKLKEEEKKRREGLKEEASKRYKIALDKKDVLAMKKYASRTTVLLPEMVAEAKELITAFGLPIVQAPSEAEAQAAYIVRQKGAYALATQDADALLFGAPRIIKNLSILGKRKKPKTLAYESVKPELIDLSKTLNNLGIDQEQLIALGMLIGTDYNIGGVKGIGPKKALDLVKKHKKGFDLLFKEVKWGDYFNTPWTEIFHLIKNIPTTDNYALEWSLPDKERMMRLLVEKHEFYPERVENVISELTNQNGKKQQKSLGEWV